MKIAVVVNELDIRGGTHKQVLRLCEYLIDNGHDVAIYTKYFDLKKTYPGFKNMKIFSTKGAREAVSASEKKKSIFNKIQTRVQVVSEDLDLLKMIPRDTDIINVHDTGMPYLLFFLRLFKGSKPKVVWQINDLPGCFFVGVSQNAVASKNSFMRKLDRAINRSAAKKSNRITVNVSKNKSRVEDQLRQSADVFYCGVDKNESLQKHTYPSDAKTIRLLSTGVFFPYRNYESLVLAVEKLNEQGYFVHLDIVGSTELDRNYADSIKELIKTKGLEDKITVWGQVDEEKYIELYNQAHMFLFLNIDQSWGLAVFEAMSCGLPTLVSNSVGAIELLSDGKDSLIIEPKDIDAICDAIIKLKNDKAYYEMISRNGMEAVEMFTWEKLYCEKAEELFYELTK